MAYGGEWAVSWTSRPPDLDKPGHDIKGGELEALLDQIDALTLTTELLTAPAWINITLLNLWTNIATFAAAGYRKVQGDTKLQLVLNISGGTTANGTPIFTLPVGWRPLSVVRLPISARIAAAPQQMGVLEISTAGSATIQDIGAATILNISGDVPLDR